LEKKNTDFDEEEEVGILALWGCSVPLLDVVAGNVDTLSGIKSQGTENGIRDDDELTILVLAGVRVWYC